MFRRAAEPISLLRDVAAILIPDGIGVTLNAGTPVLVVQSLGGNVTINVEGRLARVGSRDLDALGMEVADDAPDEHPEDATGKVDEAKLWAEMRTCYDPEIPINIVDLGLIYDCRVVPLAEARGNRVEVLMTLTAPGCGMGQVLVDDVRGKLERVPNVTEVEVELTFDPPWHQDMMSEAARLQTGMY